MHVGYDSVNLRIHHLSQEKIQFVKDRVSGPVPESVISTEEAENILNPKKLKLSLIVGVYLIIFKHLLKFII